MKYRELIEQCFLIDDPKSGQLVPFKFNRVQILYYEVLKLMGIEQKGVSLALREFIVKARREGFSSLILAIFAADDLMQTNPTESMVISYKDDATATFRKRYRRFILSFYAMQSGLAMAEVQNDANKLELFAKTAFSVDASDLELRHNKAHFYCGTAAARTGGRGGVLQKLLFSEAAHYQDTEKMTAKEIIDGTAQQVDKEAGWIFQESTGNGIGNYFYATYQAIIQGLSRYALRFYGWRSFYSDEQFKVIASEFVDSDMLKQEYPETVEEAFLSSNLSFASREDLLAMVNVDAVKKIHSQIEFGGVNYIDQCESILDYLTTLEKVNPNRSFYAGLDTAKSVDRTVLTVLMGKELAVNGGVKCLCVDATGQGDFVPDWFEKNSRIYIHRVKFSRPTKSIMYKNLQSVIQSKMTSVPLFQQGTEFASVEWKNWFRQMVMLTKQVIGEMLVVQHVNGKCNANSHDYDNCPYHDDYCDSWALAELGYVSLRGVPAGQRPPTESSNFNSAVRKLLDGKNHGNGQGIENYD